WMERGGDAPLFAPLPGEDDAADVPLGELRDLTPAVVSALEAAGYRTLNDIMDLEQEDFLGTPGLSLEDADRLVAMLNELTEEGEDGASGAGRPAVAEEEASAAAPEAGAAEDAGSDNAVPREE